MSASASPASSSSSTPAITPWRCDPDLKPVRPAFTVSSGVVTFLAALAVIAVQQRPNIPPRPPNSLVNSTDPFLWQARFSPVDWQTYSDASFLLARRSGRPILLFIGSPFSAICRNIDRALEDDTLAAYVQRNFVAIRIDGRLRPEWATALLPLQQLQSGTLPGAQLWVLDPQGRIIDGLLQTENHRTADPESLLQGLIEASRKYEDRGETVADMQRDEREMLLNGSSSAFPDMVGYANGVAEIIASGDGRFLNVGQQEPLANLVRFLTVSGQGDELRRFLDRILYSNLYDGLDGGFFRSTRGDGLEENQFDKDTAENAELAAALAAAANLTGREDWRRLAIDTFDWVATGCVSQGGLSPGRVSDAGRNGRSVRSSFPAYRLRELLSPELREFAEEEMNLKVSANPRLSPHPVRPSSVLDPRWDEVRTLLQKGAREAPSLVRLRILTIEGHASARLLEAARLLGDPERLARAVAISETLRDYRYGNDLLSRTGEIASSPATLHGYLAYADDSLQDYLSTGNVLAFERGVEALRTGLAKFATSAPGVYRAFVPDPAMKLGIVGADVPQIEDAWVESLSARTLRLLHLYGRLLRPQVEGIRMEREAEETLEKFAQIAALSRVRTAAYFASAGSMVDEDFAIAVGPKALELAQALERRCPARLVAAAFGPVRPDIQKRKPGLYIVRGAQVQGPYTLEEAVRYLSPTLQLGVG
ncbi:DUF255 domain-containing protein [bacterium]|nr:MAG: DUF255 domain-containing protein [bacterium]